MTVKPASPPPSPVPAAVPAPVALTPAEKRALREKARREFQATERERLAVTAAEKAGAPAAKPKATPGVDALPSDIPPPDVLVGWVAVFLRGVVYPVLSLAAHLPPMRGRLDLARYTPAMARDEAAAWLPLVQEYATFRAVVRWTTIPARLLENVHDLFTRKGGEAAPVKTVGGKAP